MRRGAFTTRIWKGLRCAWRLFGEFAIEPAGVTEPSSLRGRQRAALLSRAAPFSARVLCSFVRSLRFSSLNNRCLPRARRPSHRPSGGHAAFPRKISGPKMFCAVTRLAEEDWAFLDFRLCHNVNRGLRVMAMCPHSNEPPEHNSYRQPRIHRGARVPPGTILLLAVESS